MKSFHVKSILLGIGMGIVLTAFISMIYMAGYHGESLSNEQIIQKAKELGLVEPKSLFSDNENTSDTKLTEDKSKTDESKNQTDKIVQTGKDSENTAPVDDAVTVSVVKGDTTEKVAAKLLSAGLITDKTAFLKEITDMELSGSINIGDYKIKKGTGIRGIIKVITG